MSAAVRIDPEAARRELARRARARAQQEQEAVRTSLAKERRRLGLLGSLFAEQLDAVTDPSDFIALQCARRAGKTVAWLQWICHDAAHHPEYQYCYVARTRKTARQIVWPLLVEINAIFGLGLHLQEHLMRASMPGGGTLVLYGGDRPDWTRHLLGPRWRLVIIDEAPAFEHIDMRELVEEIIAPSCVDHHGRIVLMSNPGFLCHGYYWQIVASTSHRDAYERRRGLWSVHKWGWEVNPGAAPQIRAWLARQLAADPQYTASPGYRRAWANEWVHDLGLLVYAFDLARNGASQVDWDAWRKAREGRGKQVHYRLGFDLGLKDPTAFALYAFADDDPLTWELESVRHEQDDATPITLGSIAATIRGYRQLYPGIKILGDPEKKRALDALRTEYRLPITDAGKTEKQLWIAAWNDEARAGKIRVLNPHSSPAVEERMTLTWREGRILKRIEDPSVHNDCCDAALYAWRACRHLRAQPDAEKPAPGTPAHDALQMDQIVQRRLDSANRGPVGWWER